MEERTSHLRTIVESVEDYRKEGPIDFIWNGIKEGSFGYVFGPSKTGKTTFCENLALILVCRGKEFCGMPLLEKEHRVLFIHFEEYTMQRGERNDKQIQFIKPAEDLIKNLLVVDDKFPRKLDNPEAWQELRNIIEESDANIVFIDSQTRASYGDIERSAIANDVTTKLKEIAHNYGVTMVIIHHTPKLNGSNLTINSLAGSHIFAQEADFIIGINKINGVRYIKDVAYRYKREDDENVMTFDINDDFLIVPGKQVAESSLFKETDGRTDDYNRNYVRTLIKDKTTITENRTFRSKEILDEAEKTMDRSTFFTKVDELLTSGEITKIGKGEYRFNITSTT